MVSRLVILATVLALMLIAPQRAQAALWLSITVEPEQPRANEPVRVSVQTLQMSASCLTDPDAEPTPVTAYGVDSPTYVDTFKLRALPPETVGPEPDGTPAAADNDIVFEATRSERDPTVWEGAVVFPRPGAWTLRVTFPSFPGADPSCTGHEEIVTVFPDTGSATPAAGTPAAATPAD